MILGLYLKIITANFKIHKNSLTGFSDFRSKSKCLVLKPAFKICFSFFLNLVTTKTSIFFFIAC